METNSDTGPLDAPPPVPLIVLTGFLGAGKTTVLNRVLGARLPGRVAVIVNELGRIDIDGKLLRAGAGDVMELVGGCVCHEITTQEELWEGLEDIVGRSRPDVVVLESTGIAEPLPILEGLARLPPARRLVAPGGVVTVVDTSAGLGQLERFVEARQQVFAADRILLSKMDLAAPEALVAVHRALAELNPAAERVAFPPTEAGTQALATWLLQVVTPRALQDHDAHEHHHHAPHAHTHERQLVAVGHTDEAPLLAEPLLDVLSRFGPALVRVKGFVQIAGETRRGFIELAGGRVDLRFEDAPWPEGTPRTAFVLIGEELDPDGVRRQLWGCRVPGPHP